VGFYHSDERGRAKSEALYMRESSVSTSGQGSLFFSLLGASKKSGTCRMLLLIPLLRI
jgi:hypothetical protein